MAWGRWRRARVSEPRTQAGRELLADLMSSAKPVTPQKAREGILAIEKQARAQGALHELLAQEYEADQHAEALRDAPELPA